MTTKRPVITTNIQDQFRNNREMQRFLMDLSGITSETAELKNKLNIISAVADIDNPVELAKLNAELSGVMLIAIKSGVYTLYEYSLISLTENSPYIVSGSSGSWVAVGGKYINSDLNVNGSLEAKTTLNVAGVSTMNGALNAKTTLNVTGVSTMNGALNAKDALTVDGISTFKEKGTFQKDLDVTLNTNIGGTLNVDGHTDLNSTIEVDGVSTFKSRAKFENNIAVDFNATVGGTLGVTGTTSVGSLSALAIGTGTLNCISVATFRNVIALYTPISTPSAPSSGGVLYIDSSDGDFKIRFSNGTIRTIATN